MITWLLGMTEEGEDTPNLRKIARSVSKFKSELNDVSQVGEGDKSLRVDSENFQIARFNGASGREQKYHVHKDSFVHYPNSEVHGMELRKLTMVVFLNDGLDLQNPDTLM